MVLATTLDRAWAHRVPGLGAISAASTARPQRAVGRPGPRSAPGRSATFSAVMRRYDLRLGTCDHGVVSDPADVQFDVLVVGAGPSGASAAYWLATLGHRVVVVDKKRFPREKTCGDGLTPRAVRQLHDMGLADRAHGVPALRRPAFDRARHHARAGLAGSPRLPAVRLRRAAQRARRHGRPARGEGRRHAVAGDRGDRAAGRERAGHRGDRARQGRRDHPGGAGPLRDRRRRRQLAGSAGRSAPHATARTPWAWRFAAISPARSTTIPGSRAISTFGTAMGTICPDMGGYFRLATGRSTSGSGCSRRSRAGRTSTRAT